MLRMPWHRYRRLSQSAAHLVAQVGCHPIGTCNPQTMGKGVESNSSESCTVKEPSPVKIAPCTAAPYSTASSGLMDLFALCRRRTLGSRSALLGFRSSLPQAPSHARSSPRYLCLAGTHHEVHLLYQATHGCRFHVGASTAPGAPSALLPRAIASSRMASVMLPVARAAASY